jgi:hypothetical protein
MLSQELNFYQLWGKLGHAYSDCDHFYFYGLSQGQGRLKSWPNIIWTWKPMKGHEEESPPDYPTPAESCVLFSDRMRKIIDAHLGSADEVQWIPSIMRHSSGQEETYLIPHFPYNPDVLNTELSTWGENGIPMRWVLDARKLHDHEFFNAAGDNIIASHRLVKAFRAAGITGVIPRRVRMDC